MKRYHNKPYITPEVEITYCEIEEGLLANSLFVYEKPSDPNQDALCPEETVSEFPWEEESFGSSSWDEE